MKTITIQRVSVGSVAKTFAIIGVLYGFLYSALMLLVSLPFGGQAGEELGLSGMDIVAGMAGAILVYAALWAIIGSLTAWFYNIAAKRFGGIEIEFDETVLS